MKNKIVIAVLAALLVTTASTGAFAGESKEVKAAVAACKKEHKGNKKDIKACIKSAKEVKEDKAETQPAAK